ncbi:MAG TPA: CHAD domain-containing protein [Puia sp.]|nr:CHAD domain-containing protein [Puia sp.]
MDVRKEKIYKSLRKHGTRIRRTASISAWFNADDVHSFRTRVKKVRAFLHWLGRSEQKLPGSFREIYRISGELRDIQVLLKALEESKEASPAFIAWLKDNAGRLQQLWDDHYHPRVIRRLERRLRRPALKKPTAERMRSFFNEGVEQIEAVVYLPAPDDEELHEMRKRLKEMYYVYLWGKDHDYTQSDDATPELLKKLGEDCGQFNDRRIALVLLNAYIQQEKEEAAHQAAVELKQRWEEDKLNRKTQLLHTLRAFVAAH